MEKVILCLRSSLLAIFSLSFCLVTYFSLQFYQFSEVQRVSLLIAPPKAILSHYGILEVWKMY